MLDGLALIIIVIALALIFDFTNGWNDSANAIATVVATRVLKPLYAVLLAAALNLAGAFFSTAVAKMIGKGIVDPNDINLIVIIAMLIGAISWNVAMTLLGLPISASHALIGGIVGAAVAHGGFEILIAGGIYQILLAMLISPLLGALLAFILMKILNFLVAKASPSRVKRSFKWLQMLSISFMAFSHGTADAQKAMGIMMMALVSGGFIVSMEESIPFWVIGSAGLMIALGTAIGGWKVIKTMGMRLSKLEPIHGFAAETAAAIILTTVAKIGVPVSSTHTITGSIIGVGLSNRANSVRWGVASKIVYAWIFTLPGTSLVAYLMYKLLQIIGLA